MNTSSISRFQEFFWTLFIINFFLNLLDCKYKLMLCLILNLKTISVKTMDTNYNLIWKKKAEDAMVIQMTILIILGVLLTVKDFGHSSTITKMMLIINDD